MQGCVSIPHSISIDSAVLSQLRILHKILHTCLPHLSDVATLPWEVQKKSFNIIIHILQIIYVCSEENK